MKRLVWLIIALSALFTLSFFLLKKITISRIYCESQYNVCSPAITDKITQHEGKPYFVGRKDLINSLAQQDTISSYIVRYSPLTQLKVYVVEKKGDIAIKKDEDSNYSLVTRNGEIVGQASETQLPKILVKGGPIFPDEIRFSVELFYNLYVYYSIKEALLSPDGMSVAVDKYTIIFPTDGDIDVLLGSVELVLSWLNTSPEVSTIEGGLPDNIIDFRYKNPVVR